MQMRLEHEGEPSAETQLPHGHLNVRFAVMPDRKFERDGESVIVETIIFL